MNGGSGRHSSRSPEEQEQLDRIEEALSSDPEAEAPEAPVDEGCGPPMKQKTLKIRIVRK